MQVNQQILGKAIKQAIENGWENPWTPDPEHSFELIYSHDFARALWGEELEPSEHLDQAVDENWRIHLQNMIIADDPLKYLGDNI